MKSWGHMKFVMRVKLQVKWFQAKHSVTLGNWINIIFYVKSIDKLMLIILLLFVFQFAVLIKYDEKLRTYEIWNESEIASWNDFKQNIVLLLEIG